MPEGSEEYSVNVDDAKTRIKKVWRKIRKKYEKGEEVEELVELKEDISAAIERSINSNTKTYRYVLPTHILGKCVNPNINVISIQSGSDLEGSFNFRSFCKKTIVPFERENNEVLGGSGDPYVSKTLREKKLTKEVRESKRNKKGWDDLCYILERVQQKSDREFTELVFKKIMVEIYKRLKKTEISYPVPKRVSLENTVAVLQDYLTGSSGGVRLQIICTALAKALKGEYAIYDSVESSTITTADTQTGQVADINCKNKKGETVFAIEVKERHLEKVDIEDKLSIARLQNVTELAFVTKKGVKREKKIENLSKEEFAKGQNIYVIEDILSFIRSTLILLGEEGRREFLKQVGECLKNYKAPYKDRKDWSSRLKEL